MAAITAGMVKDLREKTGAGMMDCKKALTATDGDFDAAIEFLKKKGLAAAEKKASRIAAEGVCDTCVSADKKIAAVVEVNSETDFVAKNEKFRNYVAAVVAQAANTTAADIDAFLEEPWSLDNTKSVKEELSSQIAIIGENMKIRRFEKVTAGDNGFVESYIHMGGKIAVLVEMEGAYNEQTAECAKNVAMQVAAMNPQYVAKTDISADELAKMTEITIDSSLNAPFSLPKPILNELLNKCVNEKLWNETDLAAYEAEKKNQYLENFLSAEAKATLAAQAVAAKAEISANPIFAKAVVEGRVNKQLKEICLLEQPYVKEDKLNVKQYVDSVAKAAGTALAVKKVVRYETGDGLEKKNEDFAAEVAKQMGQ